MTDFTIINVIYWGKSYTMTQSTTNRECFINQFVFVPLDGRLYNDALFGVFVDYSSIENVVWKVRNENTFSNTLRQRKLVRFKFLISYPYIFEKAYEIYLQKKFLVKL